MTEVVHIVNRHGKQLKFCLETQRDLEAATPAGKHYAQRYALGDEPPFYNPLPAIRQGFEFCQRLGGGVVLLHWKQERYDD